MKTVNLICNACRKTETLDERPHYQGDVPTIVGWYRVGVAELRLPPPRQRSTGMTEILGSLSKHMPDELAEQYRLMADESARAEAEYEPLPQPVQRTADLCPECGAKALAALQPHLASEAGHYGGIQGHIMATRAR